MATFNELAVLIAEPLGRPLDVSFREQLKERIRYWRSRLIKNTLDKQPQDRKFFTQTITLPMEQIDAFQCGLSLDCKVLRSKIKVPQILRANSILFDFAGSVEGGNPFKLVKKYELYYFLKDKYAPLVTTYANFENGYLVIPFSPLVSFVRIDAIFEDPEQAALLSCASTNEAECNFDEEEYPITGEVAQLIVQSILDVDFRRKADDNGQEVKITERHTKP